jgi:hypothetical protein
MGEFLFFFLYRDKQVPQTLYDNRRIKQTIIHVGNFRFSHPHFRMKKYFEIIFQNGTNGNL